MTIRITQETIGALAVIILTAGAGGAVMYFLAGALLLGGVNKSGTRHDAISILFYPLVVIGAVAGGYLGYLLMS